jgi:hypothetical protein
MINIFDPSVSIPTVSQFLAIILMITSVFPKVIGSRFRPALASGS